VLAKGVTSFHDAGSDFETVDLLREMADDGALGVRLYVMIRTSNDELAEKLADYPLVGYADHHLTVRALKRSIDGALGPHGAWLLEPYSDMPESRGLNTATVESVTETARLAMLHDFQLNVHAIGDRANRETLDIFERAFRDDPPEADRRWRVEHAQHLHPDDIPRFADLGVIASMEGIHATSDAPWVVPRLGEQRAREGAYVWRTLMESGAVVTNGTDAPVEDVDPLASFYATVTRKTKDGTAFYPEQRLTRAEALQTYTINGAYAAFEENIKGTLTPGKLADITVLSKDILTVPEEEILTTDVVYTIVGGEVRYRRP
jgi:predicted amidohydrolase YtcJ